MLSEFYSKARVISKEQTLKKISRIISRKTSFFLDEMNRKTMVNIVKEEIHEDKSSTLQVNLK